MAAFHAPPLPPRAQDLDWSGMIIGVVAVSLGMAIVALVLIRLFGSRARARRRMRQGTQKLVDRELVTLTGLVRAHATPLVSPLLGAHCIAHRSRARLFENRRSTQITDEPVELATTSFMLETPQGRIVVETDRMELEAVPSPIPGGKRSRDRELAFLIRNGFPSERHDSAGFDEIVIELGALVTVHGMLIIEADPSATDERGYRDPARERIRITAPNDQPVVIALA